MSNFIEDMNRYLPEEFQLKYPGPDSPMSLYLQALYFVVLDEIRRTEDSLQTRIEIATDPSGKYRDSKPEPTKVPSGGVRP